jgi:hypothetical protein
VGLYGECITKDATFADGNWQFAFPKIPGADGSSTELRLLNLDALVELGGLFKGRNASDKADYQTRPEHACYAVCQKQLRSDCTTFTYDGLSKDTCDNCFALIPAD